MHHATFTPFPINHLKVASKRKARYPQHLLKGPFITAKGFKREVKKPQETAWAEKTSLFPTRLAFLTAQGDPVQQASFNFYLESHHLC